MTEYVNDATWKDKLRAVILGVYLDHGAPARFYLQSRVPFKLLEYVDPGITEKFGTIALYINIGEDARLNLANRDFVLFATKGVVAFDDTAVNFRAWDKLAQYCADNLPENADMASRQGLSEQIATKIASSLVKKCPCLKETLTALLTRALRVLLGLEQPPPERLPDWSRTFAPQPGQGGHPAAATPPAGAALHCPAGSPRPFGA